MLIRVERLCTTTSTPFTWCEEFNKITRYVMLGREGEREREGGREREKEREGGREGETKRKERKKKKNRWKEEEKRREEREKP